MNTIEPHSCDIIQEHTLVLKVQINNIDIAKDCVKMLSETGRKLSISTLKCILHPYNLKGCSIRKKPVTLKVPYKYTGKTLLGRCFFSLLRQVLNCLVTISIINLEERKIEDTSCHNCDAQVQKHCIVSVHLAAGETGVIHKRDGIMWKENQVIILKQNLKTSARKIGFKWVFLMDGDPRHTFSCNKMTQKES